jgi:vacuolar-type H+-ATPase subunit E/Vma4
MDSYKAKQCHEQMLKFISQQGNDKATSISKQGEEEVVREKAQFIAAEKERIVNDYQTKLAQDKVKLKIQLSAEDNKVRIERMSTVNALIQKLNKEAKIKIVAEQSKDINQYKEFLKNLIVQVIIINHGVNN